MQVCLVLSLIYTCVADRIAGKLIISGYKPIECTYMYIYTSYSMHICELQTFSNFSVIAVLAEMRTQMGISYEIYTVR